MLNLIKQLREVGSHVEVKIFDKFFLVVDDPVNLDFEARITPLQLGFQFLAEVHNCASLCFILESGQFTLACAVCLAVLVRHCVESFVELATRLQTTQSKHYRGPIRLCQHLGFSL